MILLPIFLVLFLYSLSQPSGHSSLSPFSHWEMYIQTFLLFLRLLGDEKKSRNNKFEAIFVQSFCRTNALDATVNWILHFQTPVLNVTKLFVGNSGNLDFWQNLILSLILSSSNYSKKKLICYMLTDFVLRLFTSEKKYCTICFKSILKVGGN